MANIVRRKESPGSLTQERGWDPIRVMRDLLHWDPFGEMTPFWPSEQRMGAFTPQFEVKEAKDSYVFKADLPGIAEKDLEISLSGNRLTVSGKREAEQRDEQETYYAYERTYGSFTRSFTLPDGVDAERIRADMKDGVLTLVIPKKPEVQPRRIEIKASGEKEKEKAKA